MMGCMTVTSEWIFIELIRFYEFLKESNDGNQVLAKIENVKNDGVQEQQASGCCCMLPAARNVACNTCAYYCRQPASLQYACADVIIYVGCQ
jgi:hypothetical protein